MLTIVQVGSKLTTLGRYVHGYKDMQILDLHCFTG